MTAIAAKRPLYGANGTVITVLWVAVLLVIWSFGTRFSLPALDEIPQAWLTLVKEQGLLHELGVSLLLNFEVILLSTLISVPLFGYLSVDPRVRPLALILSKFRFFGMAGFVTIFQRVLGGGHALKVGMLTFIMSTFFITSMIDVVVATRQQYDHTRSLRMSKWRGIWEVVVLGKLDLTFDALRQNAAIGWMSLTMVEGLSKFEGGVGVIMVNETKYRNLATIFAVQLTVLVVGILQDQGIAWLKNMCCPHSKLVLETK